MANHLPKCMGQYDFAAVAEFARQRFIEGVDTISLLSKARSEREKEEIILVSLLDIDDDIVKNIQLRCRYADQCDIEDCRKRMRCRLEQNFRRSDS